MPENFELNITEKKVLFRINCEEAVLGQEVFPEFPELTPRDISNGIAKLIKMNFVKVYGRDHNSITTTEKGDRYIIENKSAFKDIREEFFRNDVQNTGWRGK